MNLAIEVKSPKFSVNAVSKLFASHDVSDSTRREYEQRAGLFVGYVQEHGLNPNTLLLFKRSLSARQDYSTATRNKYLTTARIMLKELHRRGKIPVDIIQNIKSFKQGRLHKRIGLNRPEIERLALAISKLSPNPRNARLGALFHLLAFQGLRQIEIVRLDVTDLDLVAGTAMVHGKGEDDKERIYLAPETVKALKQYLTLYPLKSGALFKSMGNRKRERLSTMTIRREMHKLFDLLNINKTVHGFRHYFVTALLERMSIHDVRKFSRHKGYDMLIAYDDALDIKAKSQSAFDAVSPFRSNILNVR